MKTDQWDVIIVGGGHSGCEAAAAAARCGARTLLVTHRIDTIGAMSCNPAIGGLGKGHLVREIDALDGLMGHIADQSGIQFRLLNRRKGPAVRGPRAQIDRQLYKLNMQAALAQLDNLVIQQGAVHDIMVDGSKVAGIILETGEAIYCQAVVLTTGTFLRGEIHIGAERIPAGRVGEKPAIGLAHTLEKFQFPLARLKTGTPARLYHKSIDWDRLEKQFGDEEPYAFSELTDRLELDQVACGITRTNSETHKIIEENIKKSAVYSGQISGVGPRYCPSIEDKIVRFGERDGHQIFLEPEGFNCETVYPNGISTSLPKDVQLQMIHSIVGLERAEVQEYGYAIEYDHVDPRSLSLGLGSRSIEGFFLAGQINGTTGYEEAAAQGLVAGLNASRFCQNKSEVHFSRTQSYIGVMIDDLVSRGVSEPYRRFTSRAEFRLSLRSDNADQRLTPLGIDVGLVGKSRRDIFEDKQADLEHYRALLSSLTLTPSQALRHNLNVNQDGQRRNGYELLSYPDIYLKILQNIWPVLNEAPNWLVEQIEIEAIYAVYLKRQEEDAEQLKREESRMIPDEIDYRQINGLSNEMVAKFEFHRPQTMAQLSRIDGVTPAAMALVLTHLKRNERNVKALSV